MKKIKKLLFTSAVAGLILSGCQMNSDSATDTTAESAVHASLSAVSATNYQLQIPVGSTISVPQYVVNFDGGITLSDSFRNYLHEHELSGELITNTGAYFSVALDGVSGYSTAMTSSDIANSDLISGQYFYFHLYSAADSMITAPSFKSGYIRVTMTGSALQNNNGNGLTTGLSKKATYAVGQYASITQNRTAYTHSNTAYTNTVTVVLNDSINVTDWHSENGYPKSDKVESWLTLPSVTDAKFMSENISTTNLSNDTITYVISGSTANTLIETSNIQLAVPSEYLKYYSKYSTTSTVPLASSLSSSVMTIPAAAKWCFINPSIDWNTDYNIILSGTDTFKGSALITVTGDTFKSSTATGTIKPKFTFYDENGKVTSDITFVSDNWVASTDATSGTLNYQIKAAANSASASSTYYALVTFDASTLTNNEVIPTTAGVYKLYITKTADNISTAGTIAIAENSNTDITSGTKLGTFTITLPEVLSTELTAQKIYGNSDSTADYFTLAYYGTAFAGTDLAGGTGLTITGKITTNGTTATVTLYGSGTTKTTAESANLSSGSAAKLYLTLTKTGISAFGLDSGLSTEFYIGTVTLTDN